MLATDSNALRDADQLILLLYMQLIAQILSLGSVKQFLYRLAAFAMLFSAAEHVCAQVDVDKVPDARQTRPEKIEKVVVIEFQGEITYERERYFNAKFKQAQQVGCDVLIVEIDSPGGLKVESLKMARLIRNCKWAYTVVFIKNEAISGGALMSLGCDEIHISPNAKFGDIGEIGFDAEAFAWRLIEPKIESYLSRDARDLAQSKGRPADLAESMVDKDVLVFVKQDADGNNVFTTARVDDDQQPVAPWEIVPETGAERFLTLSGQRTKQLGVAQYFADSREEVLASFEGAKDSRVVEFKHTTTDTIVHWLNTPFLTGLLLVGGLVALYFELTAPGIGVGGLISALCATLFFWSRMSGGTSGWLEVILFIAGMIFLVMEIFVIPGTGIAGIGGGLLLLASVVLASQDFVVPQTVWDWNRLLVSLLTVICSCTIFLVAAFFITRSLGSLPLFNRLVLSPDAPDAPAAQASADKADQKEGADVDHPEISVGDWGKSQTQLRPSGRAVFNGRSFDVVSDGSFVEPDTQVKVIRIQGNVVTVAEVMQ